MFTGIVTGIGKVVAMEDRQGSLRRMTIASPYEADTIAIGASICCAGVCLTVTDREARPDGSWFSVDAAAETLALTTVGRWTVGTSINLERSLKIGDELGGHIVTGHVDGLARLDRIEQITEAEGDWGATAEFIMTAPREISRFVAKKGSVCLDGTSLTVNEVTGDTFNVLLIPHTLQVTSWGERKAGDDINIEVDLMARYAARLAERG